MDIDKLKSQIRWYMNDSSFLSSNYYVVLNSDSSFTPPSSTSIDASIIGMLKKIHRHRLLHKSLLSLSRHQIRMLNALFMDEYQNKYPPMIRNVFGDKTGAALCLFYDEKLLLDLCSKFYHKALNEQETIQINDLIKLTNQTYIKLMKQLQYNSYIIELGKK